MNTLQFLPPYNWLEDASIYNHDYKKIENACVIDNVDVIILYFSINGKDRDGIMQQFYEIYENAKYTNLPIEVINVPMDETKDEMYRSYDDQANWFTLMFDDPLIITLLYYYDVSSVPHLIVIKNNGSVVSSHGILDLDQYGKNALITWLSTAASCNIHKRLSKELSNYGPTWKYLTGGVGKTTKPDYLRRFSVAVGAEHAETPIVMPSDVTPEEC